LRIEKPEIENLSNSVKSQEEKRGHAELGSASHRIAPFETLKRVQGDRLANIKTEIISLK
jgi:hypothetical protein